ncbi:subtilisin-like protease 1, putative [Plasmodium ovale]|uniref:Subtilisin-like protease 1 n=2 Tax=Plasmodium ovale TaxID=36330 RepID=A0A1A8VVU6_PLAOA|nr:subtilisin-like protease 1 [Plasmodium ovale curtisi]SBS93144.1 subtilisin-like protease 1 [Plasmodium ovale curtisi]SCQ16587.1 subtilisin-like protease 1, putative [Plasmodium ovale]
MLSLRNRGVVFYPCVLHLLIFITWISIAHAGVEKKKQDDVHKIINELRFLEKVETILENSNMTISDVEADENAYNPDQDVPKEELEKLKRKDTTVQSSSTNLRKSKISEMELNKNKKKKALRLIVSENHSTSPSFFEESLLQEDVISFIQSKGTLSNLKNLKSVIIDLNSETTDEELESYIKMLEQKGALIESDKLVGADDIDLGSIKDSIKRGENPINEKNHFKNNKNTLLEVKKKGENYEDMLNSFHTDNYTNGRKEKTYVFNDEFRNLQWGLDLARLDETQHIIDMNRVTQTRVCVIDSGIDYNHPDLKDNIEINLKELYGKEGVDDDNNGVIDDIYGANFVNNNGDPMDDNYHGTHVSGIISAIGNNDIGVVGVDVNSKLIICKALDKHKLGRLGDMFKCIDYCISRKAHMINGSFSFDEYSSIFNASVEYLKSLGILFFVSASNCIHDKSSTPDITKCDLSVNVKYPPVLSKIYDNVVAVANLKKDLDDSYSLSINSFYSDIYCQVAAPGTNIYSTAPDGSYKRLNGTSMASPHVAAIASLIRSINPNLSYQKIIEILRNSVIKLPSVKSMVSWGGYIDIWKAINYAIDSTSPYVKSQSWFRWKKKKRYD